VKNQDKPEDRTMPGNAHLTKTGNGSALLHHLGCALLVMAFVNLYGIYQLVSERFGSGFVAVAPLVLPVLFFAAFFLWRRCAACLAPFDLRSVLFGLGCCLGAIVLPDSEVAVKRIHVMEYLVLSLFVRFILSSRLRGASLFVFSCLLCCLYGVHDELLQGLHPARTYGLRDMLVNAVAAIGGGLVWHGFSLFSGRFTGQVPVTGSWSRSRVLYLTGLSLTIPAMAVPLIAYRHDVFPAWPFLPLAAVMVVWSCYFINDRSTLRHGMLPVSALAFLFLAYPFAVNGLHLTFY
jgi:hypothetical protein